MTKQIVKKEETYPAISTVSKEVLERMAAVQINLESIENFVLPRVKMTPSGFELREGEDSVDIVEGTIIHAKKTNMYYAKPYNPNDVQPPDCFSLDGLTPDKSITKPQHKTCRACPKAEFGTNSRGSGKACRNLKPLYILLDDAIMPRQVVVTPASLKAANDYLSGLAVDGIPYYKVKTKIKAIKTDKNDTYMHLKFNIAKRLSPQEIADVEFLREKLGSVMDAQLIDQKEFDTKTQAVDPQGDY